MYKFADKEHKTVTNLTTGHTCIHPGVWLWRGYEKWVEEGGVTEPFDTRTPQKIAAAEAKVAQAKQRKEEIEVQREVAGLRVLTVAQAEAWIDSKIDTASTTAAKIEAIKLIFKKMLPYLLE